MNLICTLCCKSDGLPKLFRGLSPNGAEISALKKPCFAPALWHSQKTTPASMN